MEDLLMWGIVVVFAVMSILFLCGKGSFLIAGYNTASAREKAKYDEKKICRITGGSMAIITVFLIIMTLFKEEAPGGGYRINDDWDNGSGNCLYGIM